MPIEGADDMMKRTDVTIVVQFGNNSVLWQDYHIIEYLCYG